MQPSQRTVHTGVVQQNTRHYGLNLGLNLSEMIQSDTPADLFLRKKAVKFSHTGGLSSEMIQSENPADLSDPQIGVDLIWWRNVICPF